MHNVIFRANTTSKDTQQESLEHASWFGAERTSWSFRTDVFTPKRKNRTRLRKEKRTQWCRCEGVSRVSRVTRLSKVTRFCARCYEQWNWTGLFLSNKRKLLLNIRGVSTESNESNQGIGSVKWVVFFLSSSDVSAFRLFSCCVEFVPVGLRDIGLRGNKWF